MRFLHVMLRVSNLERSITFYESVLGLKVLRKKDYPSGEFTLVFLGFESESEETVIELTYNWDNRDYELGTAYGHLAFGVEDLYATCESIEEKGGKIVRPPGPMKHGTTLLAFIEDPDGYKIELLERA